MSSAVSRSRISTAASYGGLQAPVGSREHGDILAGEDGPQAAPALWTAAYPPAPSGGAPSPAQRLSPQRSFAAQKRLDRLHVGGIAQANNGLIGSRPTSTGGPHRLAWDELGEPGGGAGGMLVGGTGARLAGGGVFAAMGCAAAAAHTVVQQLPTVSLASGRTASASAEEKHVFSRIAASAEVPCTGTTIGSGLGELERQLAARGISAVYDPTGGRLIGCPDAAGRAGSSGAGSSTSGGVAAVQPVHVRVTNVAAFLEQPGPREGPVQCFILREKDGGVGSKSHRYSMFLEDGRRFLLAARRRKGKAASHYDVTTSPTAGAGTRFAPGFVGKLRGNLVGTEFTLVDAGAKSGGTTNPSSRSSGGGDRGSASSGSQADRSGPLPPRKELAAITYEPNILGTRGPRKMLVAVPRLHEQALGQIACQQSGTTGSNQTLLDLLTAEAGALEQQPQCQAQQHTPSGPISAIATRSAPGAVTLLRNKAPRWNDAMHAFCLNFGGRVLLASVKNFQLVADGVPDTVVLQFGKAGVDTFSCDFRWPLTPLQAFAICLSSFDGKLACE